MKKPSPLRVVYLFTSIMIAVALQPLFGSQAWGGSATLKILSYNLHGLPGPLAPDGGRYEQIGKMLKQRRDTQDAPQIVTIQEGFSHSSQKVISFAEYPYVRKGAQAKFFRMASGLRILSEFPFFQSGTLSYRDCAGWDCLATKGVIFTRIAVPGIPFPIDIYDTHLNSDPDTDPLTSLSDTRKVRLAQTRQMAKAMNAQSRDSLVFAPGDFNFWVGDPDYKQIMDQTQTSSALESCMRAPDVCQARKGGLPLNLSEESHLSVDHHFYASRVSAVKITPLVYLRNFDELTPNQKELSDHLGLEVHYQIEWPE